MCYHFLLLKQSIQVLCNKRIFVVLRFNVFINKYVLAFASDLKHIENHKQYELIQVNISVVTSRLSNRAVRFSNILQSRYCFLPRDVHWRNSCYFVIRHAFAITINNTNMFNAVRLKQIQTSGTTRLVMTSRYYIYHITNSKWPLF